MNDEQVKYVLLTLGPIRLCVMPIMLDLIDNVLRNTLPMDVLSSWAVYNKIYFSTYATQINLDNLRDSLNTYFYTHILPILNEIGELNPQIFSPSIEIHDHNMLVDITHNSDHEYMSFLGL